MHTPTPFLLPLKCNRASLWVGGGNITYTYEAVEHGAGHSPREAHGEQRCGCGRQTHSLWSSSNSGGGGGGGGSASAAQGDGITILCSPPEKPLSPPTHLECPSATHLPLHTANAFSGCTLVLTPAPAPPPRPATPSLPSTLGPRWGRRCYGGFSTPGPPKDGSPPIPTPTHHPSPLAPQKRKEQWGACVGVWREVPTTRLRESNSLIAQTQKEWNKGSRGPGNKRGKAVEIFPGGEDCRCGVGACSQWVGRQRARRWEQQKETREADGEAWCYRLHLPSCMCLPPPSPLPSLPSRTCSRLRSTPVYLCSPPSLSPHSLLLRHPIPRWDLLHERASFYRWADSALLGITWVMLQKPRTHAYFAWAHLEMSGCSHIHDMAVGLGNISIPLYETRYNLRIFI